MVVFDCWNLSPRLSGVDILSAEDQKMQLQVISKLPWGVKGHLNVGWTVSASRL